MQNNGYSMWYLTNSWLSRSNKYNTSTFGHIRMVCDIQAKWDPMQMKHLFQVLISFHRILSPNSDVNSNCDMVLLRAGNTYKTAQVNRKVSLNLRVKNLRYEMENGFKSGKGITYPFQRHVYLFVFQRKGPWKIRIEICMWIEAHWTVLAFRYNGSPLESAEQSSCISPADAGCQVHQGPQRPLCPAFIWRLITIFLHCGPQPDNCLKVSLL